MNNYNHPLSAPRKRYYPNLWVISLNNNYWKYTESEMKQMLSRYNGTNSAANEYGEETYHCYLIFDKYNSR